MYDEDIEIEHKHRDAMLSRRQARRFALQVLFANEFLQENILDVLERVAATLNNDTDDFTRKLVVKTSEHAAELDDLIVSNLADQNFERVALLDRILIRLALCELLFFQDIPVEVTINEALELSKEFISYKSSRFINGILDTLFRELQKDKKLGKDLFADLNMKTRLKNAISKGIKQ
jgi:transcription antitermination protein NusB